MATTEIFLNGTQEEMEELFENNKNEFDTSVRWYEIRERKEETIKFFIILRHPEKMNFANHKTYTFSDIKDIQQKYENKEVA